MLGAIDTGQAEVRYPSPRPQFFAMKALNALYESGASTRLGSDAVNLIACIVTTEDRTHYRGPVNYWNNQLQERLGIAKWERLDKARRKAIEEGWLKYSTKGSGYRSPGSYFVVIPIGAEIDYEAYPEKGYAPPKASPENGYAHPGSEPGAYPEKGEGKPQAYPKNGEGNPQASPEAYPEKGYDMGESPSLSLIPPIDRTDRPIGASDRSPLKDSVRRENQLDLTGTDWARVEYLATALGKRIPPYTERDRRMWLRFAILAQSSLPESWLMDSAEAVIRAKERKRSRQAHLVAVAISKAEELQITRENFLGMLRRIEVPSFIWKSELLPIQQRRIVSA